MYELLGNFKRQHDNEWIVVYNQRMRLTIISLLLSLALCGCGLLDPLNYDSEKGAPEGTIEERDAWGKQHLGITYQQAVDWVKQAKIVEEKIGNVITVAPLDKPNYVESFFTDGLYGTHTIEIIGDKGQAVFSVEGIAPCSSIELGSICFSDGILWTKYSRTEVHYSGVAMVEFNQLINKDKISEVTENIKKYNLQEQNQNYKIYELFIERSNLYSANQDFVNAISDIETAIALLSQLFNSEVENNHHQGQNKDFARKLERYQYWLAHNYYYTEQFDKSAEVIRSIFDNPLFAEDKQYLDQEDLWLWITRMRAGQSKIANEELNKSLELAIQQQDICWIPFAQFMISELTEAQFVEYNKNDISHNCDYIDIQRMPLTFYYIGQK